MAEILPHMVISGTATLCRTLALSRYRTTRACRVRGSRSRALFGVSGARRAVIRSGRVLRLGTVPGKQEEVICGHGKGSSVRLGDHPDVGVLFLPGPEDLLCLLVGHRAGDDDVLAVHPAGKRDLRDLEGTEPLH